MLALRNSSLRVPNHQTSKAIKKGQSVRERRNTNDLEQLVPIISRTQRHQSIIHSFKQQ